MLGVPAVNVYRTNLCVFSRGRALPFHSTSSTIPYPMSFDRKFNFSNVEYVLAIYSTVSSVDGRVLHVNLWRVRRQTAATRARETECVRCVAFILFKINRVSLRCLSFYAFQSTRCRPIHIHFTRSHLGIRKYLKRYVIPNAQKASPSPSGFQLCVCVRIAKSNSV